FENQINVASLIRSRCRLVAPTVPGPRCGPPYEGEHRGRPGNHRHHVADPLLERYNPGTRGVPHDRVGVAGPRQAGRDAVVPAADDGRTEGRPEENTPLAGGLLPPSLAPAQEPEEPGAD